MSLWVRIYCRGEVIWQPPFAAASGPTSVYMLKPCSLRDAPSQELSSGGALEPLFCLEGGCFTSLPCAAETFSDMHCHLRLFLPNPSLLLSLPRCQTSVMSEGFSWWLLLPPSLIFTGISLQQNYCTSDDICLLVNPKLHQCFLIIPLFTCASCTPAIQFSLDIFLGHHSHNP